MTGDRPQARRGFGGQRIPLIEVLDAKTASDLHARQELFLHLMMMYWLAVWELGVVDDAELRAMSADMFRNEISRRWWDRVGTVWIGTHGKPERRQFVSIVSAELARAELTPAQLPASAPHAIDDHDTKVSTTNRRRDLTLLVVAATAGGLFVAAAQSLRNGEMRIKTDGDDRT